MVNSTIDDYPYLWDTELEFLSGAGKAEAAIAEAESSDRASNRSAAISYSPKHPLTDIVARARSTLKYSA